MKSVGTKFLIPLGILAVVSSIFIFYQTYQSSRKQAYELISQQVALAMEFNLAIRNYVAKTIRPVMAKCVAKDTFIPETMSTSFVSRKIFEEARKKFPGFIIRFSSENPRNPINQATPEEQHLIEFFRQNPQVKRRDEEILIDGRRYLAHFAPMLMSRDCLQCHSDPKAAPAGLVRGYGSTGGFHLKLGDVAGLDTVAVSVEAINAFFASEMRSRLLVLAAVLSLLFGSIFCIFKFVVGRRLVAMARHMDEIAAQAESPRMTPVTVKGNDEISVVGIAFNKLLEQLRAAQACLEQRVNERTEELRRANAQLQLELTERRRAEEALRKSEEKYRLLFDHAFDAVMAFEMPSRTIIEVNETFTRLYGYSKEEAIGMSAVNLCNEPETSNHLMEKILTTGGSYVPLRWHRRKDGSIFPVELSAGLLTLNGREVVCVFAKDITERKRVENEWLQLSKLESLGTLAGGIAHDFNNILTAILGNIGLAMLEGQIGPQVRDKLSQAEQACLRAQALSRQLLTFAKGGRPIKKVISIEKLLRESAGLILSGAKSRCEFAIARGLWAIEADEGQISQVISNLLINADQAMPEGGVIKVRAENIQAENQPDFPLGSGKFVKLTFSDQGIGIAPKYLDKIFDPYFSTKQKGSGLGLATAYSIIQNHSGHIKVESRAGAGTTFEIYLPATEAQAVAAESETGKPARGHGTILVMDDEEMVSKILGKILNHLGYQVDFANDGSQAIKKFIQAKQSGRPVAAVILDLTVPGAMGGKETIQELLKIDPQVKAIVSSGYSDDPIMANFRKYGFCEVIAKPYKLLELSQTLQRVVAGQAS